MNGGGYILAGWGCWWVVVDIFWLVVGGGWWVVVDGGIVQFYPIKYYLKVSRSRLKCSL